MHKFLRNIVRFLALIIIGGYLALLFVVNYGPLQAWFGERAANMLQEKIGSEVSIGRVEIGLFNRVTLHDVLIMDRRRAELLRADLLSCRVEIRPLFEGRVALRTLSLIDAEAHLYKERTDAPLNCQYIIDAFKTERKESSHIDLRAGAVVLRRVNVTFDLHDAVPHRDRFDPAHIDIRSLNANFSLRHLTNDSMQLRLRSLAFEERSGLKVADCHFDLEATRGHLTLTNFVVRLPGSRFMQEAVEASFDTSVPLATLRLHTHIDNALISTQDLRPLIPIIGNLDEAVTLSGTVKLSPESLAVSNLSMNSNQGGLTFVGAANLSRANGRFTKTEIDVTNLETNASYIEHHARALGFSSLPNVFQRLGRINVSGHAVHIPGAPFALRGKMSTDPAQLEADILLTGSRVSGKLSTTHLNLASLLAKNDLPEELIFEAEGSLNKAGNAFPDTEGKLHLTRADWNGRRYSDIALSGMANATAFSVDVNSGDATAQLSAKAEGTWDGKQLNALRATLNTNHFEPESFGLRTGLGAPVFAAQGEIEINGFGQETMMAHAAFVNLSISSAKLNYAFGATTFDLAPSATGHHLQLDTDFVTADIDGPLSPDRFYAAARRLLSYALPGVSTELLGHNYTTLAAADTPNFASWKVDLSCKNARPFQSLLHLPLDFSGPVSLKGHLDESGHRATLLLKGDAISWGEHTVRQASLYVNGTGDHYELLAQGEKELMGRNYRIALEGDTRDDELGLRLGWNDVLQSGLRGELVTSTVRGNDAPGEEARKLVTTFEPSNIHVGDSVWTIMGGRLSWNLHGCTVQGLEVSRSGQSLTANGTYAQGSGQTLNVDLHRINVEYIVNPFKVRSVKFGGIASGRVSLALEKGTPLIGGQLHVDRLALNDGTLGDAEISANFNTQEMTIAVEADIANAAHRHAARIDGVIRPLAKSLDLDVDAHDIDIRFMRRYIGRFLNDVDGRATGHAHLGGTFKDFDIQGDVRTWARGGLPLTGCSYDLDSVRVVMKRNFITISEGTARNAHGGTASINGTVVHDYLRDFQYQFRFDADHLLIYNRGRSADLPFSSTAFASGTIAINGKPGSLDADFNVRPERGTQFTYHIDSPDDYSYASTLLTLRNAIAEVAADSFPELHNATPTPYEKAHEDLQATSTLDVHMNMLVDMQPDVGLRIVMDEKSGDDIMIYGSGPLRCTYYNKGQFQMFGTYNVDHGLYRMSIQDVIRKDFRFTEGGNVVFNGRPFDGLLNLRAVYTVPSASLADLGLGVDVAQRNVRVNCLLAFTGQVRSPQVKFDLELPTVSSDVASAVKQLISTDEEINQQVLYLLGIGRFYTYDYEQNTTTAHQSQSTSAVNSFLSNTLSSQINDIISNAVGQSDWTFGTNVATGNYGWNDVQVGGLMSGRLLRGRMLVNGNFGYRSGNVTGTSDNFVGDFDVQYLLTPRGEIRVKAYNETNDRYFTKNSLTTQGIGFVVARNFNSLRDLFRSPKNRKRKKPKADALKDE